MMGHRLAPVLASRRKRLIRTPIIYLLDSGMHAHICGLRSPPTLLTNPMSGAAIETWVLQQIRAALCAIRPRAEVGDWRTADGFEVDFVVERDGRVLGIEVTGGASPGGSDVRGLSVLREEAGERFLAGGSCTGAPGSRCSASA